MRNDRETLSLALALILLFLPFCAWRGARFARRHQAACASQGVAERYSPVIIAFSCTLGIALIGSLLPITTEGAVFERFNSYFGWSHITSSIIIALLYLFDAAPPWAYMAAPLSIYTAFWLGMVFANRNLGLTRKDRLAGAKWALAFMATVAIIGWQLAITRSRVLAPLPYKFTRYGESPELTAYRPLSEGNKLVKVRNPSLQIADEHPRFDGSTALYPVYAAAAQAIYTGLSEEELRWQVDSTKTPNAYKKLIDGEIDIIMATPPSPEQIEAARAAGVTLHLVPVAREAFVFFVHKDNPISGLTTAQIKAIYQKKIRNWQEIGGAPREIVPFQRPVGSGSQTAFLGKVMKGEAPAKALEAEELTGMGGIIREVASYRNSEKAIGYSFRYYLTTMDGNPDVKMLAIDGVEPSRETIRSGRYPFTTDLCLVTAKSENPHLQALIDWFLSPEGKALIEETGYVGIRD